MKKTVLYHANCYDGFGAAFAAWLHFGDDANYVPVSYGNPIPQIDNGSEVYILDFSYPAKDIYKFSKRMEKVVVLDHHATAQVELSINRFKSLIPSPEVVKEQPGSWFKLLNLEIHFDMNKSGAVMAWEYFMPNLRVEEFFLYLQDRDLWTFALDKSREVSMALRSYPMDFKEWSKLTGIVSVGQIHELPGIMIDQLKKEGVACRRLTEQQVNIMADNHRFFEFQDMCDSSWSLEPTLTKPCRTELGYVVPVANATVFFSEVGERLLELFQNASFSAYYLDRADGMRQWGLRSRPDFDCSKIAKVFGGGGHKQASGFVQKL